MSCYRLLLLIFTVRKAVLQATQKQAECFSISLKSRLTDWWSVSCRQIWECSWHFIQFVADLSFFVHQLVFHQSQLSEVINPWEVATVIILSFELARGLLESKKWHLHCRHSSSWKRLSMIHSRSVISVCCQTLLENTSIFHSSLCLTRARCTLLSVLKSAKVNVHCCCCFFYICLKLHILK